MTAKSLALAVALMSAVPLVGLADGPTSRPVRVGGERGVERGTDRPVDRGADRNAADRPERPRPFRQNGNGGASRTPSATEWTQILSFMREHSPRRTEELENLIAGAEEKKANYLKSLVAAQYDYVTGLKSEDAKLYDLQIDKMAAQDTIYGMLRDVSKGSAMQADQKKEFRDQVAKLVDVNLNERGRRIERARESLVKAQSTLQDDMKHREAMVDERMEQFLKEGAGRLKLDNTAPPPASPRSPGEQGAKADDRRNDDSAAADQQLSAILLTSLQK